MYGSATMQIFQKKESSILCGVDEVIALIAEYSGVQDPVTQAWIAGNTELSIKALRDGDVLNAKEPVMLIKGPYCLFAALETLYLGKLARQTKIATNVRNLVNVAGGKPIYFFGARFDDVETQRGDGYAAMVGGAAGVSTTAQAEYFEGVPVGTMPHALIAMFRGDTVEAAKAYVSRYPDRPLSVLVDYQNDSVNTAVAVANALGDKLYGVRLDTSENMKDKIFEGVDDSKNFPKALYGVNPSLVREVRSALDAAGHDKVKIMVSGGFNEGKIALFEGMGVPVDSYGVGASLLEGSNNFTADIVEVDDEPEAKVGRGLGDTSRLETVDMREYAGGNFS
jgi:nicotinate phosphoribosyltransferase